MRSIPRPHAPHHFSGDPEIAPLLIDVAPGTSLSDRASDLLVYARVYELRPSIVSSDVTYLALGSTAECPAAEPIA